MKEQIPLIDVSALSKYLVIEYTNDEFKNDLKIQALSAEIADVLMKWGFLYLTGNIIEKELISGAFSSSETFFKLEKSVKETFLRGGNSENTGYVPFKFETFEKSRPYDLKECFQFHKVFPKPDQLEAIHPGFMAKQTEFFTACEKLTILLLKLIALYLVPDNIDFFVGNHHIESEEANPTTLRQLYYPPIYDVNNVMLNQLRCGEHADYGTITLLFQDSAGGLQVVAPSGNYINATPIPDSIVVNTGAMLEIWSSGRFKATRHRVVIPSNMQRARQSMAFFVHPDNNIMVSCLDGSDKYESVNPWDYLMRKFSDTY